MDSITELKPVGPNASKVLQHGDKDLTKVMHYLP